MKGNAPVAVIDAKYKLVDGNATASAADLYQLCAYVRRTAACVGLIMQFSESTPGIAVVGTTPEKVLIVSVSITPDLMLRDRDSALDRLLLGSPVIAEAIRRRFGDGHGAEVTDRVIDLSRHVPPGAQEYVAVEKPI
jgi:hypothetical protein